MATRSKTLVGCCCISVRVVVPELDGMPGFWNCDGGCALKTETQAGTARAGQQDRAGVSKLAADGGGSGAMLAAGAG